MAQALLHTTVGWGILGLAAVSSWQRSSPSRKSCSWTSDALRRSSDRHRHRSGFRALDRRARVLFDSRQERYRQTARTRRSAVVGWSGGSRSEIFAKIFNREQRSRLRQRLDEAGWYTVTPAKMALRQVAFGLLGCTVELVLRHLERLRRHRGISASSSSRSWRRINRSPNSPARSRSARSRSKKRCRIFSTCSLRPCRPVSRSTPPWRTRRK